MDQEIRVTTRVQLSGSSEADTLRSRLRQLELENERLRAKLDQALRALNENRDHKTDRGLLLLSFDGGGVRGLSALYILRELVGPDARPCEIFDLIAGTSTGGFVVIHVPFTLKPDHSVLRLIAIMLGRLRMTVQCCIERYQDLVSTVFGHHRLLQWFGLLALEERFDSDILERVIRSVIGEDHGEQLEDSRDHACKVFVVATDTSNINNRPPKRFRTYSYGNVVADQCNIWEAARATSAAPTYFLPIEINGKTYVDGALGCNNPTEELILEARAIWPERPISCLLSIGTGTENEASLAQHLGVIPRTMLGLMKYATITEGVHNRIFDQFCGQGSYFRFSVTKLGSQVRMDAWRDVAKLEKLTMDYLAILHVAGLVDECRLLLNNGR